MKVEIPTAGEKVVTEWFFEFDEFSLESQKILRLRERAVNVKREDYILYIYFAQNKEVLSKINRYIKENEFNYSVEAYILTENHIDSEIEKYESEKRLAYTKRYRSLEKIELNDNEVLSVWEVRYLNWKTFTGIYGKEIGYQRKAMNGRFYNFFPPDGIYTDMDSFEKLLDFQDRNSHNYEEGNIQKNFIDKYVKGESILVISY